MIPLGTCIFIYPASHLTLKVALSDIFYIPIPQCIAMDLSPLFAGMCLIAICVLVALQLRFIHLISSGAHSMTRTKKGRKKVKKMITCKPLPPLPSPQTTAPPQPPPPPTRLPPPIRPSLAMIPRTPDQTRDKIVSEANPYIAEFKEKTIIVKYSGTATMKSESHQDSIVQDLVALSLVGIRPILVHGGGPDINKWFARLRIQFLNGIIVTDVPTKKITSDYMLIKKVHTHLVSFVKQDTRQCSTSSSCGFIVGDIACFDPTVSVPLTKRGYIPVIAAVGADTVNTDTLAAELAVALGAEKLIFSTDVAGIFLNKQDPGSLVQRIDIEGVKRMVDEGKVVGELVSKVNCCVHSLKEGVRTTSIINRMIRHSLLTEILTDDGAGTMITLLKE